MTWPGAHKVVRMHWAPGRLLQDNLAHRPRLARPLLPPQRLQPGLAALPLPHQARPDNVCVQVHLQEGRSGPAGRVLLQEQEPQTAA